MRACSKQQDNKHCLTYTRLNCQECENNFVLSLDFYSGYFSEDHPNFIQNLDSFLALPFGDNNLVSKQFCQLSEVPHCLEYINTRECRKCISGYILTVVGLNSRIISAFWRELPKLPTAKFTRIFRFVQNV